MKSIIQIALVVTVLCGFAYGQDMKQKKVKNNKSVFSMYVCPEKPQFTEGEEVVLYVIIKNNSNNKDSLLNIHEGTILDSTRIWNDEHKDRQANGIEMYPTPMIYTVFKGGESKLIELEANAKGITGPMLAEYYPVGLYNVSIKLTDLKKLPFEANSSFLVVKPVGAEVEEFEEAYNILSINSKKYQTLDSVYQAIDWSREFLYTHPKSVYLFRLLSFFEVIRDVYGYKYDESYVEDMKFYLQINISARRSEFFIYRIHAVIYRNSNYNKEEATRYLDKYRDDCNDEDLKAKIDRVIFVIKKSIN